MSKEYDLRYQRTHQLLQDSLMDLIQEVPFDKITIKEITDRAQVNRSTFYLHYSDIHALLSDCLVAGVTGDEGGPTQVEIRHDPKNIIARTLSYLDFCFVHPELYETVLFQFQTNPYYKSYYESILRVIDGFQKALFTGDSSIYTPDPLYSRYVLAGLARVTSEWLRKKPPYDLEHLAIYYNVLSIKTLCALMGESVPDWVDQFDVSLPHEHLDLGD